MTESERAQVQAQLDAQGGAVYERHDGAWYDEDGKAIDGVNGAFDRKSGRILISGSLLDAAGSDPMAAATLQRVLYEEEGHRVASMLEDIRGIRDFAGDEGALIARTLMLEDIGQATSGRFDQQVSLTIGGQNLSFRTDAGHLAVASLELFDANYLASDRQSGRYEFSTAGKVLGGLSAAYELGDSPLLRSAKQSLQAQIHQVGGDSLGAQALLLAVDLVFPENWTEVIPAGRLFSFGGKVLSAAGDIRKAVHKNSRAYEGETHVYAIRNPDGTLNKIGESAQGNRVRDGASIRAEQQVRRLNRELGPGHTSEIRKTLPNKDSGRLYETKLIERYRSIYGQDYLPGNKTNR